MTNGTYVFCLVSSARAPRIDRGLRGLQGMGAIRALPIDRGLFAIAADAPLARYGEAAVNRGLANIDWVSRAAVAHEKVVEHFVNARAVLPMKLFTIFDSDERALRSLTAERSRFAASAKRVAHHQEWGVRLLIDRARAEAARTPKATRAARGGLAYLTQKKIQRDAAAELATRAQQTASTLFERLAAKSRDARRRSASELPTHGGSLLLDAAFLVARSRSASFRGLAAKQARALAPLGYSVTLSGPWPPYSFVEAP